MTRSLLRGQAVRYVRGVPVARYDEIADFYEANWSDHDADPVSIALFDLVGPLRGSRVLDLACGHGRISRELARRGGEVVGLDVSKQLLKRATARESADGFGITYIHGDAASPSVLLGEVFDAIVCSFGLSDIDDLEGAIATVARLLNPHGRFVFSMLHPCFGGGQDVSGSWPAWRTYYDEGWWVADRTRSTLRQRVGSNHRMLSTYFNVLSRQDLVIDRVIEPQPPANWKHQQLDAARLPAFLVARAIRK